MRKSILCRYRIVAAALALCVAGVILSACGSGPSNASPVVRISGGNEIDTQYFGAQYPPKVVTKPSFTLTDTEGNPFNLVTDTAGKLTLLYFGYTNCPDVCPLNMYALSAALELVPAAVRNQVKVVFVTTDPDRDTATVIRTWLNHFNTSFIGLYGTIAQIQAAETATGMPLAVAQAAPEPGENYIIVHAGYVLAFTKDDRAHLEFTDTMTPRQEAKAITKLVEQGYRA
jgi:protein SCO1